MTDIVDRQTRSRMMSVIGRSDTRPELLVRSYLHRAGLRFVLHDRRLPGRPDIVLPRHRVAIFVHGCFWHRHARCRFATTPATNAEFWKTKLDRNVKRDRRSLRAIRALGWCPLVIWECEVSNVSALDRLFWRAVAAGCETTDAQAMPLRGRESGRSRAAHAWARMTWERINKLAHEWLPAPRILHPWPNQRFAAKHPR